VEARKKNTEDKKKHKENNEKQARNQQTHTPDGSCFEPNKHTNAGAGHTPGGDRRSFGRRQADAVAAKRGERSDEASGWPARQQYKLRWWGR
jgi:hypothetical protein